MPLSILLKDSFEGLIYIKMSSYALLLKFRESNSRPVNSLLAKKDDFGIITSPHSWSLDAISKSNLTNITQTIDLKIDKG